MQAEMDSSALETDLLAGAEGHTVEESTNEETAVLAVRELRTTFTKDLQDVKAYMVKFLEMQTSLMDKMVVFDAAVQGLGEQNTGRLSSPVSGRRGRSLHETKLQFLGPSFRDTNAAIPLIQLACILTVTSAAKRVPQLRGIVSSAVANYLGELQETVGEATGFGILMFAVRGNASRAKFKFATGKLWAFWLRRAMKAGITFAKKHLFRPAEDTGITEGGTTDNSASTAKLPKEPEWLSTLDTCENIEAVVSEVVGRLQATERGTPTTSSISNDSGPPFKRLKTTTDLDSGKDGIRISAGMQIRSIFTSVLNNGRAEVRSYLYLNLLFIVDRLKEFSDRNVARGAGFDVVFCQAKSEQELNPTGLSGIWQIPMARIGQAVAQRSEDSGFDENLRALKKLERDFPCLSLEIRYQREVKQASGSALDRDGRAVVVQPIMWPDMDKVSLHFVAANMLMELVSAKSISMILAASGLSLRAVHILAIALRALLLRSLEGVEKGSTDFAVTDTVLTDLERSRIGNVVYDDIGKSADLVSVKMEEMKAGGKLAVRLASNREKQFSMSFDDYKKAVEDAERERARSAAMEAVEQNATHTREPLNVRNSNDDWILGE